VQAAAYRCSFDLPVPCLFALLQAPDCKHGLRSKIKIGLCAMDKKVRRRRRHSSSSTATELAVGQRRKQCTAGDIDYVSAVLLLLLYDVAAVVQLSIVLKLSRVVMCHVCRLNVPAKASWGGCASQCTAT
jgi:hypothetical protein